MATQLPKKVILMAKERGLFEGSASYYLPDGAASPEERDHLNESILRNALDRLEKKKRRK